MQSNDGRRETKKIFLGLSCYVFGTDLPRRSRGWPRAFTHACEGGDGARIRRKNPRFGCRTTRFTLPQSVSYKINSHIYFVRLRSAHRLAALSFNFRRSESCLCARTFENTDLYRGPSALCYTLYTRSETGNDFGRTWINLVGDQFNQKQIHPKPKLSIDPIGKSI